MNGLRMVAWVALLTACSIDVPEAKKFLANQDAVAPAQDVDAVLGGTDAAVDEGTAPVEVDAGPDVAPDLPPEVLPDLPADAPVEVVQEVDISPDLPPDVPEDIDVTAEVDAAPDVPVDLCKAVTKCDDGNPCTDDPCEAGKGCVHAPNAATCTDGNTCTVGDLCKGGACLPGTETACNDQNPCTADKCDKSIGCTFKPVDGQACDDGNPCTKADACVNGVCKPGSCTCQCGCDPKTADQDCASKEDGNQCNGTLYCDMQTGLHQCKIKPSSVIVCATDQDTACSQATCEPATGKCGQKPVADGTACSDGDVCTSSDLCKGGTCLPGAATSCDDGNACTDDACDKGKGCSHTFSNVGSKCQDDGIACTVDACDGKGACVQNVAGACLIDGKCVAVGANPGNPCQKCIGGQKIWAAVSGACEDGDKCTDKDQCEGGVCKAGKAVNCDDGNGCTDDGCDQASGCTAANNNGACDDGTACTTGDACAGGTCVAGIPKYFDASYGGKANDAAFAVVALPDGFAFAGATLSSGAGSEDFWLVRTDATGKKQWEKTYGEGLADRAWALVALPSGFALAGYAGPDAWLVRTDAQGKELGTTKYGGGGYDGAYALAGLPDGFAFAGDTNSTGAGGPDFWLVRTDDKGNQLWEKTYGGSGQDHARTLVALPDGFALAGWTTSKGAGLQDFWLVRTDAAGNALWDRTFGGSGYEAVAALVALPNGFALAGGKEEAKGPDSWLVRTDSQGNKLWDRSFGTSGAAFALTVVPDGLALCVHTTLGDTMLLRTDAQGNKAWDTTFVGKSDGEKALAALPTGFVIAATAKSKAGDKDAWLIRTDAFGHASCAESGLCLAKSVTSCDDANTCTADSCDGKTGCTHKPLPDGTACQDGQPCTVLAQCDGKGSCAAGKPKLWSVMAGDKSVFEQANAVAVLPDGGLAVVGLKGEGNAADWFVLRHDAAGAELWKETYGWKGGDVAYGVQPAGADGGLAIAGRIHDGNSYQGFFKRTDANGSSLKDVQYGGSGQDFVYAIVPRPEGGFALVGTTDSSGAGQSDAWLVFVDDNGAKLAEKTYGTSAQESTSGVALVPGGGYLLVGDSDAPSNGSVYHAYAVRVDKSGTTLWTKLHSAGSKNDSTSTVLSHPDGGFLVAGRTESKGAGMNDAWLLRLDAQGNKLWDQTLGGNANDAFNGIGLLPNGGAVLAGYSAGGIPGVTDGGLLVGVDKAGNVQWKQGVGPGARFDAVSVLKDGFVAVGTYWGSSEQQAWVVRTDGWGHAECGKSGVCAAKPVAECDDGAVCTLDACNPVQGCTHLPAADGLECSSSAACGAVCSSGQCKGGGNCANMTSKDGCVVGYCKVTDGAPPSCATKPAAIGQACNADDNGCTTGDACTGEGACAPGPAVDCLSEASSCALGACKSTGASTFTCEGNPKPDGTACAAGKKCTAGKCQ